MKTEALKRKKPAVLFYLTDAGNLLRLKANSDVCEIFNPKTRKWEIPDFKMEDIFSVLPVSKKEVGGIIKHMTKTARQHYE
jgi:hypothetical protein